jgi:hypothetical protein
MVLAVDKKISAAKTPKKSNDLAVDNRSCFNKSSLIHGDLVKLICKKKDSSSLFFNILKLVVD